MTENRLNSDAMKESISELSGWTFCHRKLKGERESNEVIKLDFLVFMQIEINHKASRGWGDVR